MSFEKLKGLIGDSPEAMEVVQSLEASATSNIETINNLERKVSDVTLTRDKFKEGNATVKRILGLDAINEDTLKSVIDGKGKGDEGLTAEIDNLKNMLSLKDGEFDTEKNGLITQIRELKNGSQLNEIIAKSGVVDDATARADLAKVVQSMISYDDDNNVIFLNDDKQTTKFNGSNPFTMQDAVQEALNQRAYLKGPDGKGGSGTPTGKTPTGVTTMSRSNFGQQSPEAQSKFMQNGGKLTD